MNVTELRNLLSKATPRPWAIYPGNNLGGDDSAGEYQQLLRNNKIHCPSDAALIVALVNNAGALLDEVEQLSRDLAKAREEIERLRHDIDAYRLSLGEVVPGPHDGRLSDWTAPVNRNAADVAHMYEEQREAYDALWKEKELLLSVLKNWLEFAKDSFVTVGEREFDKLGYLERRTQKVLKA